MIIPWLGLQSRHLLQPGVILEGGFEGQLSGEHGQDLGDGGADVAERRLRVVAEDDVERHRPAWGQIIDSISPVTSLRPSHWSFPTLYEE